MANNCKCGHPREQHSHDKSCTAIVDEVRLKYCPCGEFRESKGENEMAKEKKVRAKKEKGEGRVPSLAPFAKDNPFKIWMTYDGKEREATVLTSGVIRYKGKDYNSPSSAATAVLKEFGAKGLRDGWQSWKMNDKDGKRVALDTLRGIKSPLKAADAPKPRKAKSAKANGSAKPKAPRKARAKRPTAVAEPPTAAQERAQDAIEATA